MEQQYFIPQKRKTPEGIRGKNIKLIEEYVSTVDGDTREKIKDSLIMNNLPLAYAVADWWYRHRLREVSYQTIEDLRQDSIVALVKRIKGGEFSLHPKKFSIDIYRRISNVFYQYFNEMSSRDALNYSVGWVDLDSFISETEINTDLDSFWIDFEGARSISLNSNEDFILKSIIIGDSSFVYLGEILGLSKERVRMIYERSIQILGYEKEMNGKFIHRLHPTIYLDLLRRYLG